jgi:predicted DNA-binding protein
LVVKSEMTTQSYYLPRELKERVDAQAKREKRSASTLVAIMLEEALEARAPRGKAASR